MSCSIQRRGRGIFGPNVAHAADEPPAVAGSQVPRTTRSRANRVSSHVLSQSGADVAHLGESGSRQRPSSAPRRLRRPRSLSSLRISCLVLCRFEPSISRNAQRPNVPRLFTRRHPHRLRGLHLRFLLLLLLPGHFEDQVQQVGGAAAVVDLHDQVRVVVAGPAVAGVRDAEADALVLGVGPHLVHLFELLQTMVSQSLSCGTRLKWHFAGSVVQQSLTVSKETPAVVPSEVGRGQLGTQPLLPAGRGDDGACDLLAHRVLLLAEHAAGRGRCRRRSPRSASRRRGRRASRGRCRAAAGTARAGRGSGAAAGAWRAGTRPSAGAAPSPRPG